MYHIFYTTKSDRDLTSQVNLTKTQLLKQLQIDILEGTEEFDDLIDDFIDEATSLTYNDFLSEFKFVWDHRLEASYEYRYADYLVYQTYPNGELRKVDLFELDVVAVGLARQVFKFIQKIGKD